MAMFVFGDASVLAGPQRSAPVTKGTVTVLESATLGGTTLAQGKYEAEISGSDDATLVLKRDKREVARVRVKRTALAAPAKYDRIDVRPTASGKVVVAIYFKGDPRSFEVVDDQGVAIAEKP
jgi:hypothetical protein